MMRLTTLIFFVFTSAGLASPPRIFPLLAESPCDLFFFVLITGVAASLLAWRLVTLLSSSFLDYGHVHFIVAFPVLLHFFALLQNIFWKLHEPLVFQCFQRLLPRRNRTFIYHTWLMLTKHFTCNLFLMSEHTMCGSCIQCCVAFWCEMLHDTKGVTHTTRVSITTSCATHVVQARRRLLSVVDEAMYNPRFSAVQCGGP